MGIESGEHFIQAVTKQFPLLFKRLAGTAEAMQTRAMLVGRKWAHGMEAARQLFTVSPPP